MPDVNKLTDKSVNPIPELPEAVKSAAGDH